MTKRIWNDKKNRVLSSSSKPCCTQIRSKPEFSRSLLEIRRARGRPSSINSPLKTKTGKAGRQHRSAAQARVAMYFVFGIAVEDLLMMNRKNLLVHQRPDLGKPTGFFPKNA